MERPKSHSHQMFTHTFSTVRHQRRCSSCSCLPPLTRRRPARSFIRTTFRLCRCTYLQTGKTSYLPLARQKTASPRTTLFASFYLATGQVLSGFDESMHTRMSSLSPYARTSIVSRLHPLGTCFFLRWLSFALPRRTLRLALVPCNFSNPAAKPCREIVPR